MEERAGERRSVFLPLFENIERPLSLTLSPLLPRGERERTRARACRSPSPPSDGGEGWGEEETIDLRIPSPRSGTGSRKLRTVSRCALLGWRFLDPQSQEGRQQHEYASRHHRVNQIAAQHVFHERAERER